MKIKCSSESLELWNWGGPENEAFAFRAWARWWGGCAEGETPSTPSALTGCGTLGRFSAPEFQCLHLWRGLGGSHHQLWALEGWKAERRRSAQSSASPDAPGMFEAVIASALKELWEGKNQRGPGTRMRVSPGLLRQRNKTNSTLFKALVTKVSLYPL